MANVISAFSALSDMLEYAGVRHDVATLTLPKDDFYRLQNAFRASDEFKNYMTSQQMLEFGRFNEMTIAGVKIKPTYSAPVYRS